MNKEWLKLRAYNGDIKQGFEELICQLARAEKIRNKKKFIRVGAPDSGVEAYCILSNGIEFGWQAKFFSTVGESQWNQLEKSFKTALAKHPQLEKYYICLPLDRQDPNISNQDWFMDKWKQKVNKWTDFATKKGRRIQFEYWGDSEIFDMLSKTENIGKQNYWFNTEEYSDEWFKKRLDESIANLDKRYTRELNFQLPIAKIFDGLARDNNFRDQWMNYYDNFLKKYNKVISNVAQKKGVIVKVKKIISLTNQFRKLCDCIDFSEIEIISRSDLILSIQKISEVNYEIINQLNKLDALKKIKKKKKDGYENPGNSYGWEINYLREFNYSISDFKDFIEGLTVELSNNPYLLITGEAGKGKSHLIADITQKRIKQNKNSILLLGQHFNTDEPWAQIKNLLQIKEDRDTFLSLLNSKAESAQSRILIFIDALNEGQGKELWNKHLSGFILAIKRFPYLGLILSVRSSYEKLIVPDNLFKNNEIIKVTHDGFVGHEYEVCKLFFKSYGIQEPSIPILHQEFSNPLFLKLFCEGLHKQHLKIIPEGYSGISTIINFYLDAINELLSRKYSIPPQIRLIQNFTQQIANRIAESKRNYISFDEGFSLFSNLPEVSAIHNRNQLFEDLFSEGLLTQNNYWTSDNTSIVGIYISYERFKDHLVASYLIKKYFDPLNPQKAFLSDSPIFYLIKDEHSSYFNKGIIDSISIQIPEISEYELYEIVGKAKDSHPIVLSFIESILWRKKETIKPKVLEYINSVVIKRRISSDEFMNTILLVTAVPNHFFNSDFLHKNLSIKKMANRDAGWTQFIHHQFPLYEQESPIKRMIEWAWKNEEKKEISDESLRLICQTMFWLLTSSNRVLRDSATKALICLLEERINVLIELVKIFAEVNDPYVLQRLYAVAYGCAVRTSKTDSIKELSNLIFHKVFDDKFVIPDILLRDYARGVIEYSLKCGHEFDFELKKIRPPYKSRLVKNFPTDLEISKYEFDYKAKDYKDYYASQNIIIHSMAPEHGKRMYGDFGRYTFESGFRNWKVPIIGLSNLGLKMILKNYGYDVEKHGRFDREIGSGRGRSNIKEERIGKKYEWIAFYELLAKVSDNYLFKKDPWHNNSEKYEGPWNPYVRDIDPTTIINQKDLKNEKELWWKQPSYSNWNVEDSKWIFEKRDLVDPRKMIRVKDSQGIPWVILESHFSYNEPPIIGEEEYEKPRKQIWYQIRSYLTKNNEHNKIIKGLQRKNFMGRWMPESSSRYEMFSREYYSSPASGTFGNAYYHGNNWNTIHDQKTGKSIGNVAVTAINYLWEEEFDASKKSTISIYKPSQKLFNLLNLKYSKNEGELLNSNNKVIAFDPSVQNQTFSCLLIKEDDLLAKLKKSGLNIFWTVLGEKNIIGGREPTRDYPGRLDISGLIYYNGKRLIHQSHYEKV